MKILRRRLRIPLEGRLPSHSETTSHYDAGSGIFFTSVPSAAWGIDMQAERIVWEERRPDLKRDYQADSGLRVDREEPCCLVIPGGRVILELIEDILPTRVWLVATELKTGKALWSTSHVAPAFVNVPHPDPLYQICRMSGEIQVCLACFDGMPHLVWCRLTARAGSAPAGVPPWCCRKHFRWAIERIDPATGAMTPGLTIEDTESIEPDGYFARGDQLLRIRAGASQPELLHTTKGWIRDLLTTNDAVYVASHHRGVLHALKLNRHAHTVAVFDFKCPSPRAVRLHAVPGEPILQLNQQTALVIKDTFDGCWKTECAPGFGTPWKTPSQTILARYRTGKDPRPELMIFDTPTGDLIRTVEDRHFAGYPMGSWTELRTTRWHLKTGVSAVNIAGIVLMDFAMFESHCEPGGVLGGIQGVLDGGRYFTSPGGPDPHVIVSEVRED